MFDTPLAPQAHVEMMDQCGIGVSCRSIRSLVWWMCA
jgi:hypothetical protein